MPIRSSGRRLAIRAALACALVAGAAKPIDSAYWWRSPRFVAVLQLSPQQARLLDEIYRTALPERLKRAEEAETAHARFEQVSGADVPDEEFEAAASQAADADSARRSLRAKMLYRMWRVLTPGQRAQLERLAAGRPRSRDRSAW